MQEVLLGISAFIVSIAFLLFVLFAIPSLLQVRRTAETMATTLRTLNENLPVILKNIEAITTHVSQASSTVNRQIDELSESFRKLQKTLLFLVELGQIVQAGIRVPFLNTVTSLAAVAKGLRVFLSVLSEKSALPDSPQKK
jgi:uncharacterized protein YoxC